MLRLGKCGSVFVSYSRKLNNYNVSKCGVWTSVDLCGPVWTSVDKGARTICSKKESSIHINTGGGADVGLQGTTDKYEEDMNR